ncbi:MAG TPA: FAD-binding protein [Humisphaera sp.]
MDHAPARPPRDPLVPPGGVDLHARDMTATFSADVTFAEAQARLAAVGQWLPVDGDETDTLGRLVDANTTGPLRLGYGGWRDLLLGAQFTNGRGELISAGGRTVKNVAGYDLTKFVVGARGAAGRLVTLTTRTYRRPAGAIVATFEPTPERFGLLMPSPLRPQWAVLTGDALTCGYLGDERTLAFYADRLPAAGSRDVARRTVDEDIAHRRTLWVVRGERTLRASVPPATVTEFATAAGLTDWSADAAFGVVVANAAANDDRRALDAAVAAGGSAWIYDSTGTQAARAPEASNVERDLVARLVRAFGTTGA